MNDKARFHARIWSKLLRHDRAHRLVKPGDRVLIAVSGGPDSVCLAHFLARLAERRPIQFRLAHFHHGLRGRSADRDAESVRRLGAALGVPVTVHRLAVAETARRQGRSIEEAGRLLRYRALERIARRTGCSTVATGHQLDDQAETVLLHLLRGTRPEGLAGIPLRRPLAPHIEVVRPLLCLTREEVLEYLRYHEVPWREDPTNRSLEFRRNWVRHKLLPLLEHEAPGIRGRLALMAAALGQGRRAPAERGTPSPHARPSRRAGKHRLERRRQHG